MTISAVNRYNNSYGTWIASEWLTHYDPCTCISTMKIIFEPKLQNITALDLSIDGSSYTEPIYSSSNSDNSGDLRAVIAQTGGFVEKISGAYKKGNEVYKNFDKLETLIEDNVADPASLQAPGPNILKDITTIVTGVASGNYLATAAGILSFVNTLVGSSTSKTISSYSSDHEFQAAGTQTTDAPYQAAEIYIPGSEHEGYPDARKPIYDNILGVSSIIETPKFDVLYNHDVELDGGPGQPPTVRRRSHTYYKLNENFRYGVNENAGILSVPKNAKVSLYFDISYNFGGTISSVSEIEAEELIMVTPTLLRTPYMNLSRLLDYPVDFMFFNNQAGPNVSFSINHTYIKLALILETETQNEIGDLKSYEIKEIEPDYSWENKADNNFIGIPEDLTIDFGEITTETKTWGTTTVIDPPGKIIIIQNDDGSSSIFELDTDNDASTPVIFTTEDFAIDCGEVLPVTFSDLNAFCKSTKYNPIVALLEDTNNEASVIDERSFKIHPNPSADILNVAVVNNGEFVYSIYSAQGKLIAEGNLIDNQIDISSIPTGVYFLQLQSIDNAQTFRYEKFIKF